MKRTLMLCLVCLLVVGALALPTAAQATDRITVQVMSWWDITKSTPLKELKRGFEEANPDIELDFPMIGSKYADKISTVIAGGGDSVPDVIMLAMDLVPKFAKAGAIQPLNSYLSEDYKNSLYPVVLDALTVDGSVYAAARDVSPMAMYLNTQLFEEAGIDIPSPDWTVEDFLEIAKKLTKTDDQGVATQWGYYFPKYPDTIYDWIIAFGGRLISEDGTKGMISSEGTKKGLQFMYDLIYTEALRGRIAGFHLHNNNGMEDQHNWIHEGTMDIRRMMKIIRSSGEEPDLILEYGDTHGKNTSDLLDDLNSL